VDGDPGFDSRRRHFADHHYRALTAASRATVEISLPDESMRGLLLT
jgi:hypothetical protein